MTGLGQLLFFTDQVYWRDQNQITSDRAFIVFVQSLLSAFDKILILGRLHPEPGNAAYPCTDRPELEFRELPYYSSIHSPFGVMKSLWGGLHTAWSSVGQASAVMLGIPSPWALLLYLICRARRRPSIFLVRQDLVARVMLRPAGLGRWFSLLITRVMETLFIIASRKTLTFTVGEVMQRRYGRPEAPAFSIMISLVPSERIRSAPARTLPTENPKRLLWVGRFHADKGLDVLLEALCSLPEKVRRNLILDLVGDGPLEHLVRADVRSRGLEKQVCIHGYVPQGAGLEEFYEHASLFVLPSRTEGFPQVIIEAMATGLPVIASAVGGIPGAIHDGVQALLVPPGKSEALGRALSKVLGNPAVYHGLSSEGLKLARNHSLEVERDRMLQIITPYLRKRERKF